MDDAPAADAVRVHAPELDPGDGGAWLNTDRPLLLQGELRGKLVLLDFWAYCCINCLHCLGELERLQRLFPDELVVVGVHAAKFTAEKDTDSVRQAVLRYGVEHPVVCDPEMRIWSAYTIDAWPSFVLIGPDGYVIGAVSGEGQFGLIEQVLREQSAALRATGELTLGRLDLRLERDRERGGALRFPGKVVADERAERLFIADSGHHRVVVTTLDGELREVVGDGRAGAVDGGFAAARFTSPQGMALAGDVLYVADTGNHLVRAVDLAARTVTTVAGSGVQAAAPNQPGHGRDVALNSPWDLVAVDLAAGPGGGGTGERFLFVAMSGAHQLWVVDLTTGNAYPYAGSGDENIRDGLRVEACFAQPSGVGFDGQRLFIADSEVSAVRCLDLATEAVTTVLGGGLFRFGDRDGDFYEALLQHPLGLAVAGRRAWVADSYNHKVKEIDLEEGTVRTVAGDGHPGRDDGSPGRLREPSGLGYAGGRLFVADTNNHAVRWLDPDRGELHTLSLDGLS